MGATSQSPTNAHASDTTPSPDYSNRALVLRILRLTWRYKAVCIEVFGLQLVLLTLGLLGLNLTGVGIDYLRDALDPSAAPAQWPFWLPVPAAGTSVLHGLLFIVGGILGLALVRAFLNYLYTVALGKLTQHHLVADLRAEVYDKLQRLSFRFFDENASGSIINRCTGDVQNLRLFVDGVLIQIFIMLVSLTVYILYMVHISPRLTLACLATTPILWLYSMQFARAIRPSYVENRELMDQLVLSFAECIQGVNTIKGFALEKQAAARFAAENDRVAQQRHGIFRQVSRYSPIMDMMTQFNMVVLLGYGGWMFMQGQISLGAGLVVFAGLLQQFSSQVNTIATVADSVQQSLTGARRVFEILDAPVEVQSPARPAALGKVRGEIVFENVNFQYKAENAVLHDVSFAVKPGEFIAIAGATGSGKSVLMSLIPRFYDPTSGTIRLDGHDLRDLSLEELRHSIGLVFQENFLFSNTVGANIAFGSPRASQEQIERAAKIAAADRFIKELPLGYETLLGESGVNLSGGQRQRLALARALLQDPAILLLDDPTAAVDPGTEQEIIAALESAVQGRTTFIVAHRLSTLRRADRVLVLERGRLVQFGPHLELMETPGPYRRAISLQGLDSDSMKLLQRTRVPWAKAGGGDSAAGEARLDDLPETRFPPSPEGGGS